MFQDPTNTGTWPIKVNPNVSNDDPLIDVTFNKRKYNYDDIDPYLEEAAEKHITGVRNRYPMLTKLLMNARPQDTANLSSARNTDKYARLADAYNAKYIFNPTQITTNNGGTSNSITNVQHWTPINPISTQDQKQMDTRRQTEGKLYDYVIGEESYAQRQLLENRLKEMWLRLEQEYGDEFFDTNEEKKRISAMFEMWSSMEEEEFTQLLNKMHIPAAQSQYVTDLVKSGQYFKAMNFLVNNNHSAMLAQEALNMFAQGDVLKNYLNGFLTSDEAYKAFGGRRQASLRLYARLSVSLFSRSCPPATFLDRHTE